MGMDRPRSLSAIGLGVLAALALGASAHAGPESLPGAAHRVEMLAPAGEIGALPRGISYSEDFESFVDLSPLNNQQGWRSTIGATLVETIFPTLGERTAVAVAIPTGEFIPDAMVSPALTPSPGVVSFDFVVVADLGHEFLIDLGDVFSGLTSVRILLTLEGEIYALTLQGGQPIFLKTSGFWVPFVPTTLSVEITHDGLLIIRQNGDPIFGGPDIVTDQTGETVGISRLTVAVNEIGEGEVEYALDNIVYEARVETAPADLDGDGVVGASDLALLLGAWGAAAPTP